MALWHFPFIPPLGPIIYLSSSCVVNLICHQILVSPELFNLCADHLFDCLSCLHCVLCYQVYFPSSGNDERIFEQERCKHLWAWHVSKNCEADESRGLFWRHTAVRWFLSRLQATNFIQLFYSSVASSKRSRLHVLDVANRIQVRSWVQRRQCAGVSHREALVHRSKPRRWRQEDLDLGCQLLYLFAFWSFRRLIPCTVQPSSSEPYSNRRHQWFFVTNNKSLSHKLYPLYELAFFIHPTGEYSHHSDFHGMLSLVMSLWMCHVEEGQLNSSYPVSPWHTIERVTESGR